MVKGSGNVLTYAPVTPWYRRRRLRRAGILVLLILAAGTAIYQIGPKARERFEFARELAACEGYSMATSEVVYAETPVGTPPAVVRPATVFEPLDRRFKLDSRASFATVYLEALTTHDGERRMAHVRIRKRKAGETALLIETCLVWKEGFWGMPLEWDVTDRWAIPVETAAGGKNLWFYAGERDPGDESAIDIRYEMDGKMHRLHGKLSPNGWMMEFENHP